MTEPTNRKPTHIAYHVRDRENGNAFWTRIGVAWGHNDGKGFSLQLEAAPLDGRVTLRIAEDKKD